MLRSAAGSLRSRESRPSWLLCDSLKTAVRPEEPELGPLSLLTEAQVGRLPVTRSTTAARTLRFRSNAAKMKVPCRPLKMRNGYQSQSGPPKRATKPNICRREERYVFVACVYHLNVYNVGSMSM